MTDHVQNVINFYMRFPRTMIIDASYNKHVADIPIFKTITISYSDKKYPLYDLFDEDIKELKQEIGKHDLEFLLKQINSSMNKHDLLSFLDNQSNLSKRDRKIISTNYNRLSKIAMDLNTKTNGQVYIQGGKLGNMKELLIKMQIFINKYTT